MAELTNNNANFPFLIHLIGACVAASGSGTIKLVEVSSVGNYFDTSDPVMSLENLGKALVGLDSASESAIMVDLTQSVLSADPLATTANFPMDWYSFAKQVIGRTATGQPCIRLSIDLI